MDINKFKVLAAMVRAFFDAYSTGVIEGQADGSSAPHTPQTVKKLMLEYYERIAPAFFDIMFYPLAAMNFDYAGIERIVRSAKERGDDMMALVRAACAGDAMYEAMVAEYKRNFANLLSGRHASNAAHLAAYTRHDGDGMDDARAVELVVRVVMFAYARGLRQTTGGKASLGQATLFRMMLDSMNVLLNDEAVEFGDGDDADLGAMFLKVCHTDRLFTAMTDEMDRTADELVRREDMR